MISENSPLNLIPTELRRRDVFLVEGIRYAVSIVDLSYKNLINILNRISTEEKSDSQTHYSIFKEAWTIIDFSWKLKKILLQINQEQQPDNGNQNEKHLDIRFLEQLKKFRDTFQHLDERIDEVMVNENAYVLGTISWLYVINEKKVYSCSVAPGHPRASSDLINPAGLIVTQGSCHITLDSIHRNGEKLKIDISNLLETMQEFVTKFEIFLTQEFDKLDRTKQFGQDLFIKAIMESGKNV